MNSAQIEEMAALRAVGLLDEAGMRALERAAAEDPAAARIVAEFADYAAGLAYDAPQVEPPGGLREKLLRGLPARRAEGKVVAFPRWIPYALAACLMGLTIYEAKLILGLKERVEALRAEGDSLRAANGLGKLQVIALEAKDPAYATAKVMVAWDPVMNHGVVSAENLPAAPAGHDYQFWVLDPKAAAPVNAGLLRKSSENFAPAPIRTPAPGFAVSLEPGGGQPEPTGAILFAVAPGQ
jgi:anti-sigma-K factor RskA